MLQQIFFQGWEPIVRTAISTSASYLALIILLRAAGQRTLAKWYALAMSDIPELGGSIKASESK